MWGKDKSVSDPTHRWGHCTQNKYLSNTMIEKMGQHECNKDPKHSGKCKCAYCGQEN